MADHDRRPALPRLHLGHRRDQHRARAPARRRGHPGPGGEAAPRPAEHRLPRAGPAALRTPGAPAPGRAVVGVPVQLGGGGGRGRGQARARRDRAPGDHRVPLRLPRPDRPGDVADGGEGRLPRGVRAAPGIRLPRRLPVLLPGVGRPARPVGLHLRLGGAARPAVPPARLPRQGGRDHRGTDHRRGRLHRPVADVPAPPARDHPQARDPAHRRRGPDGLRAHGRDVRGPALGRRARHRRHGQGHRLGPAAVGDPGAQGPHGPPAARLARRHVRRQRGLVRGGERDARRHRGRGPRGQRARARRPAARRACGGHAWAGEASATSAAWA